MWLVSINLGSLPKRVCPCSKLGLARRRPMPLTAAGGANAVNAQEEAGGGGGAGAGGEAGQPAVKKAKGADKSKKRALKRL